MLNGGACRPAVAAGRTDGRTSPARSPEERATNARRSSMAAPCWMEVGGAGVIVRRRDLYGEERSGSSGRPGRRRNADDADAAAACVEQAAASAEPALVRDAHRDDRHPTP